jgi:hypothetical protein
MFHYGPACLLSQDLCVLVIRSFLRHWAFGLFFLFRYYTTSVSVMLGLSFASLYAPETQRMANIALKVVHDKVQVYYPEVSDPCNLHNSQIKTHNLLTRKNHHAIDSSKSRRHPGLHLGPGWRHPSSFSADYISRITSKP